MNGAKIRRFWDDFAEKFLVPKFHSLSSHKTPGNLGSCGTATSKNRRTGSPFRGTELLGREPVITARSYGTAEISLNSISSKMTSSPSDDSPLLRPYGMAVNSIWERNCGGNSIADSKVTRTRDGASGNTIARKRAFPNRVWEREE